MPSIAKHHSKAAVKLLLLGDSGTGKTASLLSLAKAGYNLRILDFDNGLDILSSLAAQEKDAEAIANRIHYVTCTDEMKTNKAGNVIPKGQPSAYPKAIKMLTNWADDDVDFGNVGDWGSNDVLVIDSLTFMSNAIMRWHLFNVGRIGQQPWQSDWGEAQRKVMEVLDLLYSTSISCNVVVLAHIKFQEIAEGETHGYPDSLGRALPPQIPRFFNTVLQAKVVGQGKSAKRKIAVVPTSTLGLKFAAPGALSESELPLETGLATVFSAIKGEKDSHPTPT